MARFSAPPDPDSRVQGEGQNRADHRNDVGRVIKAELGLFRPAGPAVDRQVGFSLDLRAVGILAPQKGPAAHPAGIQVNSKGPEDDPAVARLNSEGPVRQVPTKVRGNRQGNDKRRREDEEGPEPGPIRPVGKFSLQLHRRRPAPTGKPAEGGAE